MYLSKYKGPLCSAKMQIFNFAFAAAVSASQGVTQSKKSIAPNYLRVDISPFAARKAPETPNVSTLPVFAACPNNGNFANTESNS